MYISEKYRLFVWIEAFSAFGLNLESAIDFHFENNLHAPFDATDLLSLISQYKNSGSFFIELVLAKPFITIKAEVNFFYSPVWVWDLTSTKILMFAFLWIYVCRPFAITSRIKKNNICWTREKMEIFCAGRMKKNWSICFTHIWWNSIQTRHHRVKSSKFAKLPSNCFHIWD